MRIISPFPVQRENGIDGKLSNAGMTDRTLPILKFNIANLQHQHVGNTDSPISAPVSSVRISGVECDACDLTASPDECQLCESLKFSVFI